MSGYAEARSGSIRFQGLATARGEAFFGIPYAKAPVGALRFRPPVPAEYESSVHATIPGPAAPQIIRPRPDWAPRSSDFATGEDCLNLNVFTPAADGQKRPVIVHVFGGGFQTGSVNGGYQDDEGFVANGDVVLVRPNMRVGALGFLHLEQAFGSEFAEANRGMLDLVAALRWIQEHIAAFGGDPNNVTLLGMSSGAFTAASLPGVEGVDGLFHKLWLMSGSASRIVDAGTAASMTDEFLNLAGIAPGDIEALCALPVDRILDIQDRIVATDLGARNAPGGRTFGIVADGTSLARHPLEALGSGQWSDIDIVTGWTRNEARMWYAFGIMNEPQDRSRVLETIARFDPDNAASRLMELECELPQASLGELEEAFLSRTIYRDAALRTLDAHRAGGGRGLGYEFSWVPAFEDGRLGASHGFDEPFVFGNVEAGRIPLAVDDDQAVSLAERLNSALMQLAHDGIASVDTNPAPFLAWFSADT